MIQISYNSDFIAKQLDNEDIKRGIEYGNSVVAYFDTSNKIIAAYCDDGSYSLLQGQPYFLITSLRYLLWYKDQ